MRVSRQIVAPSVKSARASSVSPTRKVASATVKVSKNNVVHTKGGAITFRRPLAIAVINPPAPFNVYPPLSAPPPLPPMAQGEDESFFKYTSGRWLYNESAQLAQRYVKFDVQALRNIIAGVCGSPVVSMDKKEGLFNKSFIVTLEDGTQIAARIKNPIAGPDHLMTASEVATMDYARNHLGIPVPKVLAWSSRAGSNSVGAEFILMEMAPGVPLNTVWGQMDSRRRKNVVMSLVDYEKKLFKGKFSHYGSLYYKEDISEAQRAPTLFASSVRNPDMAAEAKFCIGPSATRSFHEAERAEMDIDRGPWSSPEDYLRSVALREEAWIAKYANPHIHDDPFKCVLGPQSQDEHIEVLRQYRTIVPALVPEDEKLTTSMLWHPDLNPGNVFVSDDRIVSIIDWQGTWAGPAYLQLDVPSFVHSGFDLPSGADLPRLPEDFDAFSYESQELLQREHRAKMLHKLYEMKQLFGHRVPAREARVLPTRAAGRTWKDGILPLRLALLEVRARWAALATPDAPCPLEFSEDELTALRAQRERYVRWHDLLDELRAAFGLRLFGWVAAEEYARKRDVLEKTRSGLDPGLIDEMEKIVPRDWWPFRDTVQS